MNRSYKQSTKNRLVLGFDTGAFSAFINPSKKIKCEIFRKENPHGAKL